MRRQVWAVLGGWRRRVWAVPVGRRLAWRVGALTLALALLPAVANSEPFTVEAVNEGIYGHHWTHAQQTVAAGESVAFANATTVPHGIEWRSAVKPVCEEGAGKVPVGTTPAASGTQWSGKCKFTQPGTYTFWCTVHGAEMSGTITVANPGEPTAGTETATPVTEHEATLRGAVNPQGKPTEYFFKYGTTTAYGSETATQSAGEGTASVPVSAIVSGLSPGTTYHFKLIATNEKGTAEGSDRTFTTTSPPSSPPPPKEEPKPPPPEEPKPSPPAEEPKPPASPAPAPNTNPSPGPISPEPEIAPLIPSPGPPLVQGSLELGGSRRGQVHGSVEVSHTGSGGRLEVDLLTKGLSRALKTLSRRGHRAKQVSMGRLVRESVPSGKISFSIGVNARAKSALRHRRKLALTVKVTLTPPRGAAETVTQSLVLRS